MLILIILKVQFMIGFASTIFFPFVFHIHILSSHGAWLFLFKYRKF